MRSFIQECIPLRVHARVVVSGIQLNTSSLVDMHAHLRSCFTSYGKPTRFALISVSVVLHRAQHALGADPSAQAE